MQPWDSYKTVTLARGELVERIHNYNQKDWIKACKKLGLPVSIRNGRGSHATVYKHDCPPGRKECCVVTLVKGMHQNIQRDFVKKVVCYGLQSGRYTEDDVWRALGVLD